MSIHIGAKENEIANITANPVVKAYIDLMNEMQTADKETYDILNEKKKKANDDKKNLFAKFQAEYGRSLSGMDFECINGWLDSGFSEELIIGAVKEASYNGVSSLRYIDTILFEWKKKGLTKMSEVNSYIKKREESKTELIEDNVLEYNWLDDE